MSRMGVEINPVWKIEKLEESDHRQVVVNVYEKFSSVLKKSETVKKKVDMRSEKSSLNKYMCMKQLELGKS